MKQTFKLKDLARTPEWDKPWSEEERTRYAGILARSGDRALGRQRAELGMQARPDGSFNTADGRMPEARAREFFGKHYENVLAESDFRRELMDTARAMDEGRLPYTPEAAQALIDRQQNWLASHPSRLIPPEDLNVDAL